MCVRIDTIQINKLLITFSNLLVIDKKTNIEKYNNYA